MSNVLARLAATPCSGKRLRDLSPEERTEFLGSLANAFYESLDAQSAMLRSQSLPDNLSDALQIVLNDPDVDIEPQLLDDVPTDNAIKLIDAVVKRERWKVAVQAAELKRNPASEPATISVKRPDGTSTTVTSSELNSLLDAHDRRREGILRRELARSVYSLAPTTHEQPSPAVMATVLAWLQGRVLDRNRHDISPAVCHDMDGATPVSEPVVRIWPSEFHDHLGALNANVAAVVEECKRLGWIVEARSFGQTDTETWFYSVPLSIRDAYIESEPSSEVKRVDESNEPAKLTANERLMVEFTRDQSCISRTAGEWGELLGVDASTIRKTVTWVNVIAKERERSRAERKPRSGASGRKVVRKRV